MRKYIIIGGGPAGLTAGLLLANKKEKVLIFEAAKQVGGIAKTIVFKGNRFDIGGHRFFAKYRSINKFWRDILGKDLLLIKRSSKIFYKNKFYHYPLEPLNALTNLGSWQAMLAFLSYLKVKVNPRRPQNSLEDVYINSFGRFLYQKFFQTYSTRLWGLSPSQMEPDWGQARVGKLSLLNAIKDAFSPKTTKVKSLIKKFHYPKFGPGQMWEAVAKKIIQKKGKIFLNSRVKKIFHRARKITGIEVETLPGSKKLKVEQLISSMSIKDLINSFSPKPPAKVVRAANKLKYRNFIVVALIIDKKDLFPDQWIYLQDPGLTALRIQNINNWSRAMVADKNKTVLELEYTTGENDPFWHLKDKELIQLARSEVVRLGFARPEQIIDAKVVREPKVYPVYDLGYRCHLDLVRDYLTKFSNLTLIGRNGMHKYNNMDHSMLIAILAVENFYGAKNDIWQVTDAEIDYLEKLSPGRWAR